MVIIKEVQNLIAQYDKITIVTHLNPDADTIGTALGLYGMFKNLKKQVEVVNYGTNLPIQLDFLPNFSKIKSKINYDNSLVIVCDTGSIDRVGFNLEGRVIINIDHHKSNTHFGTLNIIEADASSASQVAYELFKNDYTITKEIATCFYTALVSDTQYFSTSNVSKKVFDVASELMNHGVDIANVVYNINQRCSLSSFRILHRALESLDLQHNGTLAIMFVTQKMMIETGAKLLDTVAVINHGISLATVNIAVFLIELEGVIRVSIRSKKVDVSSLAVTFGGGGHKNAAGFEIEGKTIEELKKIIIKEIEKKD